MTIRQEKYLYQKYKYEISQDLIDEILQEIEPSKDKWDRGYNAGLRFVLRRLKQYQEEYQQKFNIKGES